MNKISIIKHRDISTDSLLELCELKASCWPYPIQSQIEWIRKNISDDDLHILLYQNGRTEAYLNLISIDLKIDNNKRTGFGIGNVCSKNKGLGFGGKLMIETGTFLSNEKSIGLLFCKSALVNFYSKFNWTLVDKSKLSLKVNNEYFETMIYGCPDFSMIEYSGSQF